MLENYPNPYMGMQMPQFQNPFMAQIQQPMINHPQQQVPQTNIVYVNGIDDVRSRQLPPNSNYAFMDNDNPILYRKTVDAQGRMSVEVFDIVPHKDDPAVNPEYALKSDIESLKAEIEKLRLEVVKND